MLLSMLMSAQYQVLLFLWLLVLPTKRFAGIWEHVILADCTSSAGIRVSHMAYYVQTMKVAPNTVTVIPSAWNQTTPWVRNTSDPLMGTFPDAVAFWANISVTKAQGDFAGKSS